MELTSIVPNNSKPGEVGGRQAGEAVGWEGSGNMRRCCSLPRPAMRGLHGWAGPVCLPARLPACLPTARQR